MTWKRGEMCESCAGRKGTDANSTPGTVEMLAECIKTGYEPFYCHESTAELDPDGWSGGPPRQHISKAAVQSVASLPRLHERACGKAMTGADHHSPNLG